ncbi:F1-FO ATP synthase subunit J [Schizosaccharomyces osmophilus]|uniref:F1-FO ATP synthase subunit J n=1 Tax=Schizosaccharomyces osmophilus TaxID=2545709 RepID=A0AAE9WA52_9SCHI|nr:F1-FO ATP synthase subunit J [Schizosaccharomyces osmophilus]WBW71631.1 F1-FO ATP synthase subunit J [Schizosaccharomyces osmophilus]
MAFFGLRAYSTPILKPMYPFILGGGIIFYGTYKLRNALLAAEEKKNEKPASGH